MSEAAALAFLETCSRENTICKVTKSFRHLVGELGFPHLVCGVLGKPERYGTAAPLLIAEFPAHWMDHYYRSGYERIDPIIRFASANTLPFRWHDFAMPLTERRVLQDAADAGLHDGVVIPIHGPGGELFCVSLATDDPIAARQANLPLLRLLAVQYQSAVLSLRPPTEAHLPRLSPREAECLTYCAIGKTSWEIGQILNISEKTVEFHMGNAMRKLDASSRVLAVVKAIRFGIISP